MGSSGTDKEEHFHLRLEFRRDRGMVCAVVKIQNSIVDAIAISVVLEQCDIF